MNCSTAVRPISSVRGSVTTKKLAATIATIATMRSIQFSRVIKKPMAPAPQQITHAALQADQHVDELRLLRQASTAGNGGTKAPGRTEFVDGTLGTVSS